MLHDYSDFFSRHKDTSFINLNNGTLGLCPDSVLEQQKDELDTFERNTTRSLGRAWPRIWNIQKKLAHFFDGHEHDLFFRPNVTLALNEMIMGLSLPNKSEILSTHLEYGAVLNILKYKSRRENVDLRLLSLDFVQNAFSDNDWIHFFESSLQPNTRLVVLSHVYTSQGLIAPIQKIGLMLRNKGIAMIVDGAHAPGLIDLRFSQLSGVDFYAGNLHKWMMGPKGTAFGWVHPLYQSQTYPLYASWTTEAVDPLVYGEMSPFAIRMLWSHSQSFSTYFALESCLDFWHLHGKEAIFREIRKRMLYLEEALAREGKYPVLSVRRGAAAFLAYLKSDLQNLNIKDNIISHGLLSLQVGLPKVSGQPVIRLTPHIHNTQVELESSLEILNS